jgi:hypothetical protein
MQTLFNDSEVFQKERPKTVTANQLDEFYKVRAKEIISQGFSDSDEEDIIQDLQNLYPFNDNGYEMARRLEVCPSASEYEFNTDFCEFLDSLDFEYRQILSENVKAWVKAHDIKPKFEKGTKLLIKRTLCHGLIKDMEVYVNSINSNQFHSDDRNDGNYCIDTNPKRNGGTVLAYELVESNCELIKKNQKNQKNE